MVAIWRAGTIRGQRDEAHRDRLLAVKRGEMPWAEVDAWRKELHRDFERALAETKLPERPDYEAANRFLVKARREMAKSQTWMDGCTHLDHTPPSSVMK